MIEPEISNTVEDIINFVHEFVGGKKCNEQ